MIICLYLNYRVGLIVLDYGGVYVICDIVCLFVFVYVLQLMESFYLRELFFFVDSVVKGVIDVILVFVER